MVLPVWGELSRSRADDGRARGFSRSFHDLSLGPEIRAGDRAAPALAVAAAAFHELAGGRDLCESARRVGLSLSGVGKHGDTIDFYLSSTRNTKAAKRFLGKALGGLKDWEKPCVINTDKAPTYAAALAALKKEGKCPEDVGHRQIKYMNNVIEADHGKLKQLIRPVRGFKTLKTAYATIKSFEVMRALRKGQAGCFNITRDNSRRGTDRGARLRPR